MTKLIVLHDSVNITDGFQLGRVQSCTLGRHSSCDIVIASRMVSRVHAQIERRGIDYVLFDLGSSNGTYVNRVRLYTSHCLMTGDEMGLGYAQPLLRFYNPDESTAEPPERDWIEYDPQSMVFMLKGKPLQLSISQFRLMLHLYRHAGEVCSREECATIVWGADYDRGQIANLDEVINKLRNKLVRGIPESEDALRDIIRKGLITTRPGLGYILNLRPETILDPDMLQWVQPHYSMQR